MIKINCILVITLFLTSGCLSSDTNDSEENGNGEIVLTIWYTFEGKEEDVFLNSIVQFEEFEKNIKVEAISKPYGSSEQAFVTAALGDEAPDIMRFSSDQLGYVGKFRQNGFPLLEDLLPYLTPIEREAWDPNAINGMMYEGSLLGLPASQDCLSLIYNKALFDMNDVDYPNNNWTTDDLLETSIALTKGNQHGIAFPSKSPYWWFAFQSGFGGDLFTDGYSSLTSNGSAESLNFTLNFELEHELFPAGTGVEQMENLFMESKAAMVIDGPWNWAEYQAARLQIGQVLLPLNQDSSDRMSPMVNFKGYSISKQSENKDAAFKLISWLSSVSVQKEFAIQTYTMPTLVEVYDDDQIKNNSVISGFIEQLKVGFPAPIDDEFSP
jgi:maltose-binding protein MalE